VDYAASESEIEKITERVSGLIRMARGGVNHNECLSALSAAKKLIGFYKLNPKDFGLKVPKAQPSQRSEPEWEMPPSFVQVIPHGTSMGGSPANPLVEEMKYHDGWLLFTNWVGHRNVEQMWAECFDAPSMLWYAWLRGVPLGYQVLALCAVANLSRKRLSHPDPRFAEALKVMMQMCVNDPSRPLDTAVLVKAMELANSAYPSELLRGTPKTTVVEPNKLMAAEVSKVIEQIAEYAIRAVAEWPETTAATQRRMNDALRSVESSIGYSLDCWPEAADAVRKYIPFEVLQEALFQDIFADGKYPYKPLDGAMRKAELGGTSPKFCDQCGARHAPRAQFCASCGKKAL
jgi:hypothetical protein